MHVHDSPLRLTPNHGVRPTPRVREPSAFPTRVARQVSWEAMRNCLPVAHPRRDEVSPDGLGDGGLLKFGDGAQTVPVGTP